MATESIKKVSNDSASGYCRMPDGTLIEWGSFSVSIGANTYIESELAFPIEFYNAPSLALTPQIWSNPADYSWVVRSASQSNPTLRLGNRGSATTVKWLWIAIGRWK